MITVRKAAPTDYADFARWVTELGVDDRPPDRERWCEQYMPGMIVAELADAALGPRPAGYAVYTRNDDDVYVRNVVTDPAFRRRGVGRALLSWIARTSRADGATTWRLNVRPDNRPAVALYQSFGMQQVHASAALRIECEVCRKLRDSRAAERVTSRDAWADLETQHKLPRGTLAWRVQHGDVVLATKAKRSLALLDPSFPGAFTFKPLDAADAEALLRAMLSQSPDGAAIMQIVIEDNESMIEHLIGRGAYIQMRFVHYAGSLSEVADFLTC